MMLILYSILMLVAVAAVSAIILYFASQKFKVFEDGRIADVETILPGANCGGCGFAGCKMFAEKTVQAEKLDDLYCTAGGQKTMSTVAEILHKNVAEKAQTTAIIRCNGNLANRIYTFDGEKTCAIAALTCGGENGCSYGCLGYGDCVAVCKFGAITINDISGLPEIDGEKCTSCMMCAKICPKKVIEIRKKEENTVFVCCVNKDKGAVAMKACKTACIGCAKCEKVCEFRAISIKNFLAHIDDKKCTRCGRCVAVCPTAAIAGKPMTEKQNDYENI